MDSMIGHTLTSFGIFLSFKYRESSTRRLNSQACAEKIKGKIKDNVKDGVIVGSGIFGLFTVCFDLRIKYIN